ncbi:TIR domain-containing protein [Nesterenkonia sp. CF4.4]|uniref:TIR domain-containing protein n=1 Tax=Nesterenkonia sp. CF4.4 TaxID=3373079 RepID=UPI003EE7FC92
MATLLKSYTRHKTFISYHHSDEEEVSSFINTFDHDHDILISRGIGASMSGDIIDSTNPDYIKQRIRQLYLRDSSVTLVMVGAATWGRRFVDWEIAASLRNTSTSSRNGLVAVTLPSVSGLPGRKPPERVKDNLDGDAGYARWMQYPSSAAILAAMIDNAYNRRSTHGDVVDNSRPLRLRNAG